MHKEKLSPAVAKLGTQVQGMHQPELASPAGTGGVFPLWPRWFAPVKPLLIILALSCLGPEGKVLQKAL